MKSILQMIDILEANKFYKTADIFQEALVKVAAEPYNVLDSLPYNARNVDYKSNEEDYNQYDDLVWKELKQRIPEYRSVNQDADDDQGMETNMHGENSVGVAYVDPGNLASSPSMSGGPDDFTWDQTHDTNDGVDYWKNLIPRR